MLKHIWSVPCLRLIVDETSKFPSLIDVVDSIKVEADKPIVLPAFHMVSRWIKQEVDPDKLIFSYKLSLKGPGENKKKLIKNFAIEFPPKTNKLVVDITVGNTKLPEPGEWFLIAEWKLPDQRKWNSASVFPLTVETAPVPANPPT